MKISICIPVYNFDVRELVFDLKKEIISKNLRAEIILIDDASEQTYKKINREIVDEVENFINLEKNVGRSQIRNLFLYYSKGNYMLFLDCDGKIILPNFIENYLHFLEENKSAKVVYGGRIVSEKKPDHQHILRWKFANERENLPVEKRKEFPHLSFQTNNFVVKKTVLEKVNFNPEFQKYGYEDLLFAMDLSSKGIEIFHIDNPIFNNDLETNESYLKKVEESVESLSKMFKNKKTSGKLQQIKLIKAYQKIKNSRAETVFLKIFDLRKNAIKTKLTSDKANLRYLDFYKLGLFLEKMKD